MVQVSIDLDRIESVGLRTGLFWCNKEARSMLKHMLEYMVDLYNDQFLDGEQRITN